MIDVIHSDNKKLNSLIMLALAGCLIAMIGLLWQTVSSSYVYAPASMSKQTSGQLKSLATHISKMLDGSSVGGFPGFEPPEDDEAYRQKIRKRSYNGQDVNDWVSEMNNYLRQIIKQNPNMTLEEILQKMGWSQARIANFLNNLREVHVIARGWKNHGVREITIERFEAQMQQLGVVLWE
ncbi:hypothetical protein QUF64_12160 [Anaerolineales bacterium HSG6]|nr:hypothetical protein [Anaerolineales bacterium HSG6]